MGSIQILAHTEGLHRQIRDLHFQGAPTFIETLGALRENKKEAISIAVKLDNAFHLGDICRLIARELGISEHPILPNPPVEPLRRVYTNYLIAKHDLEFWLRKHNVRAFLEEDPLVAVTLRSIQEAASTEERDQLLRYLSIACNTAFLGPEIMHLDIANSCNSNCVFCGYHSPLIEHYDWKSEDWNKQRLPYPKFLEIVEDLRDLRVNKHIAVVGEGDPSTHPRIMDILQTLKENDLGTALYSNCSAFSREQLIAMVDYGVDAVYVNVSAGSPESYAIVQPRQPKGRFASLTENLKAMVEYREARGKQPPDVIIKHVLTAQNCHELPQMLEHCRYIGAKSMYPELMHFSGNNTKHLMPSPAQLLALQKDWREIQKPAKNYGITLSDHLSIQFDGLKNDKTDDLLWTYDTYRKRGCYAGWFFSRIYTDLTLGFCCRHRKLWDLKETRFRDAWFSAEYNDIRVKAKYFNAKKNYQCSNNNPLLGRDCNQCGNFYTNQTYFDGLTRLNLNNRTPPL